MKKITIRIPFGKIKIRISRTVPNAIIAKKGDRNIEKTSTKIEANARIKINLPVITTPEAIIPTFSLI